MRNPAGTFTARTGVRMGLIRAVLLVDETSSNKKEYTMIPLGRLGFTAFRPLTCCQSFCGSAEGSIKARGLGHLCNYVFGPRSRSRGLVSKLRQRARCLLT